jgi:CBS domain containing-hemolysin-like protein
MCHLISISKNDNTRNLAIEAHDQTSTEEWTIPGSTLVNEVSDILRIEFQPRGRYKTIAGFIMTELGNIPDEGDQLRMHGYTFKVLSKDRLRIADVRITKNQITDDRS